MPMIATHGSDLKEIKTYIKRVNALNDFDLAWRWYNDQSTEPMIEVYEEAEEHTLCIAKPHLVIFNMKRVLSDWFLTDPDA